MFAGPGDSNDAKTVIASLNFKPTKDLWFNLIGFGGAEASNVGLIGGSVLAGYQATSALNIGFEGDYFSFDGPGPGTAEIWSLGTFVSYDFNPKFGIGLRAEYLDDPGGNIPATPHLVVPPAGSPPGTPNSTIGFGSPDSDGNLASVALTFNYKPVAGIKIQPEVRYDTTSYKGGLDGKHSRFILGVGVSYSF